MTVVPATPHRLSIFAALLLTGGLNTAAGAEPKSRFTVPDGFQVKLAVKNPGNLGPFSLVNMCFDARGRLLVSQEGGPTLLCTDPDRDGVLQTVRPYCEQVKNSQGMCWIDDALYLVGNGPKGTGLYRCRDTKNADKIDDVTLLHAFQGGIGEHGPHAVIHGPDNFLYLVIGNHAHARVDGKQCKLADNSPLKRWPTGLMGPDQTRPHTTEDVLLPRQNDANGHAANILAPGGTIWRCDKNGQNFALVSAGYRNQFDAAFNSAGELFTFDSDMEWDIGLPWYRPVRMCFCPPGSDFVWRTGSANTPDYYVDSLPSAADTGRGSPVGVECYEHYAFPEKYRGSFFMCDWSLGIIYAAHPKRDGAGYKLDVDKFCTGKPLNVTDCAVAPDGSLVFTMGGRGTQGGVYRVGYTGKGTSGTYPQPLSSWGRAMIAKAEKEGKVTGRFVPVPPHAEHRAYEVYRLGLRAEQENDGVKKDLAKQAILSAVTDEDNLVKRRACEALIRAGFEPPVDAIWPLLADNDRYLRTAARLVLQRIDPKMWADRIGKETNDRVAWEAVIALCKIDQAGPYAEAIFQRLGKAQPKDAPALLDWARTCQLALIHAPAKSPAELAAIAKRCAALFPHPNKFVSRELAILLTHFRREKIIGEPVHEELLKALQAANGDREQQIHYFYCLRLLHDGWTAEQKNALLGWFESTAPWSGGNSFRGFLDNIFKDLGPAFTAEDRASVLAKADQYPRSAALLLKFAPAGQLPPVGKLVEVYDRLAKAPAAGSDMKAMLVAAIAQSKEADAPAALRQLFDKEKAQRVRGAIAQSLARFSPAEENWPYLVRGLPEADRLAVIDVIGALKKLKTKPKPDEGAPFRAVLVAASRFDERDQKNRWRTVELLRHWGVREFGAEKGQANDELKALARWFGQSFPKEPALPGSLTGKPPESKYKFAELLAFLEKDPVGKKGDVARGRMVFEKAQCIKCHKFGKDGEGIGPDLSAVSKRFKRADILESLLDPSKVISDQYRSSTVVTTKGVQLHGLVAVQGDTVTVLQNDGSKVQLKKDEIEQQIASLVSVMPEKLLDALTKQEIADLFAFLESEPKP